jgi:hypothetical protein
MSFYHLLPGTIILFGFPVYVLLITCSQGLLHYLAFLFVSFWSLAARDYSINWLSCLCPFDHLLPGTIKLCGFPVYVLFITSSQGLLHYLAFLFMSFWSLAPRDYSIDWLSILLIMIVPDEDYFLFRYVLLLLVSFHYCSLCFVSFPFRKYIIKNIEQG